MFQRFLYGFYFCFLIYLLFLMKHSGTLSVDINLTLFQTIKLFINALIHGYAPISVIIFNLLGNVVIMIPLGMLIWQLFGQMPWYYLLGISVYIPAQIESAQFMLNVSGYGMRTIDIDDVLLNACGIVLGYVIFKMISRGAGR